MKTPVLPLQNTDPMIIGAKVKNQSHGTASTGLLKFLSNHGRKGCLFFNQINCTKMPSKHTIIIEGVVDGNKLEMSDRGKTDVRKTDTVIWKLHQKSGVERIIDIKYKDPTKNVFSADPAEVPDSTDWEGTIKNEEIKDSIVEEYYIQFKKTGLPGVYTYDPIIQMNP